MPGTPPIRLCFVCLGNICRSPTAAAVMAHKVRQAGLGDVIEVESAGTSGWHIGEPPDRRATAEARRRGIPMTNQGKRFTKADFARYDLVLAMDAQNADDLLAIAPDDAARAKVRLLRSFAPGIDPSGDMAVPDPYFGGDDGFTAVFDMIDAACAGLLEHLRTAAPPAR
ncbi:MAG: low molecular weight protein-tyrosine phosphatase [Miltoncostaeaceae bacterium]|jgi:protein-tyrosine phosphatase|nr:low molecular weight protein-tyrosine phosphatase [Miltoncostaeaceae bacterium]